eukprot:2754493-Rhodomonas_salina.2
MHNGVTYAVTHHCDHWHLRVHRTGARQSDTTPEAAAASPESPGRALRRRRAVTRKECQQQPVRAGTGKAATTVASHQVGREGRRLLDTARRREPEGRGECPRRPASMRLRVDGECCLQINLESRRTKAQAGVGGGGGRTRVENLCTTGFAIQNPFAQKRRHHPKKTLYTGLKPHNSQLHRTRPTRGPHWRESRPWRVWLCDYRDLSETKNLKKKARHGCCTTGTLSRARF